jgi:hypothetical protein
MSTRRRKKYFSGVERSRCLRLTTLPPSMSRFSTQYGILNITQPCRPARPVTGIKLKLNSVALVRERTIATEWLPLAGEVSANFPDRGCRVVILTDPHGRILGFLDRSRYFLFQVAPQLYSRGWLDLVPDPLLYRKSGTAGKRNRAFVSCSQELWPPDHRGGSCYGDSFTFMCKFKEERDCGWTRSLVVAITLWFSTWRE